MRNRLLKFFVLSGIGAAYLSELMGFQNYSRKKYLNILKRIERTNIMSLWRWRHLLQFFYERSKPVAEQQYNDPLFSSGCSPRVQLKKIGLAIADFSFDGLRFIGFVPGHAGQKLKLLIEDHLIKETGIGKVLSFAIRRDALAEFPGDSTLKVFLDNVEVFSFRLGLTKCSTYDHFKERLPKIDKKGALLPTSTEVKELHRQMISLYDKARTYFLEKKNAHLMLLYGTLLGAYRDGELIPYDDDFDTGYFSNAKSPEELKGEMLRLIKELIAEGFTVSCNRSGRLFRLHDPSSGKESVHLDITPIWQDRGRVWSHNHFTMEGDRTDFLPVMEGRLNGVKTFMPAGVEKFLVAQYGNGWKEPDPGFSYKQSSIPSWVKKYMGRAFVSPEEAITCMEETSNKFIALGVIDFYPIKRIENYLE